MGERRPSRAAGGRRVRRSLASLVLVAATLLGCGDGPTPTDAGVDAGRRVCPPAPGEICFEGWCWLNPWPIGTHLRGVWGADRDRYWAVGENGIWLEWDGCHWMVPPRPTGPDGATIALEYTAIWGFGADDLWAIGADFIEHRREVVAEGVGGTTLWGPRSGDLYIGARFGEVGRYLDGVYTPEVGAPESPGGLWGTGDEVWLASRAGALWRRDADGTWVRVAETGTIVNGVWGTSTDEVWAVGGEIHRWDGVSLDSRPSPTSQSLEAVWAMEEAAVAVGGSGMVVYDGERWRDVGADATRLSAVHGTAPDDAWAVGGGGALVHWDGAEASTYSRDEIPPPPETPYAPGQLSGIWGMASDDLWITTPGQVLHFDGSRWEERLRRAGHDFTGIAGASNDEVYVVGNEGSDLEGVLLHWDGAEWTEVFRGGRGDYLSSVWVAGPGSAWAVGVQRILRLRDGTWEEVTRPPGAFGFAAVWGVSEDHIWVTAIGGVFELNEGEWSHPLELEPDTTRLLHAIHGSSADDVWAVGAGGVHHGTAEGWVTLDPRNQSASGVLANGDGTAWVAGFWNGREGATPLRLVDGRPYDEGGERYVHLGTQSAMRALFRSPDGTIHLAGASGSLLVLRP